MTLSRSAGSVAPRVAAEARTPRRDHAQKRQPLDRRRELNLVADHLDHSSAVELAEQMAQHERGGVAAQAIGQLRAGERRCAGGREQLAHDRAFKRSEFLADHLRPSALFEIAFAFVRP